MIITSSSGALLVIMGILGGMYYILQKQTFKAILVVALANLFFLVYIIRFSSRLNFTSPAMQLGLLIEFLAILLVVVFKKDYQKTKATPYSIWTGLVLLFVFFITTLIFKWRFPLQTHQFIIFVLLISFVFSSNKNYIIVSLFMYFSHIFCLATGVYLSGIYDLSWPFRIITFIIVLLPLWAQILSFSFSIKEARDQIVEEAGFLFFILIAISIQIRYFV